MLMIRLARFGAKKKPTYRVVVIEKERARDSRSVEVVGTYSPGGEAGGGESEARPDRALDEERRAAVGYRGAAVEDQSGPCRASSRKRRPVQSVRIDPTGG